ncbi:unnamed protein product [Peniophora sp. CBMAI 1063]|nr:unnamed protein product [Peniophora sp. CBMAI 1063]
MALPPERPPATSSTQTRYPRKVYRPSHPSAARLPREAPALRRGSTLEGFRSAPPNSEHELSPDEDLDFDFDDPEFNQQGRPIAVNTRTTKAANGPSGSRAAALTQPSNSSQTRLPRRARSNTTHGPSVAEYSRHSTTTDDMAVPIPETSKSKGKAKALTCDRPQSLSARAMFVGDPSSSSHHAPLSQATAIPPARARPSLKNDVSAKNPALSRVDQSSKTFSSPSLARVQSIRPRVKMYEELLSSSDDIADSTQVPKFGLNVPSGLSHTATRSTLRRSMPASTKDIPAPMRTTLQTSNATVTGSIGAESPQPRRTSVTAPRASRATRSDEVVSVNCPSTSLEPRQGTRTPPSPRAAPLLRSRSSGSIAASYFDFESISPTPEHRENIASRDGLSPDPLLRAPPPHTAVNREDTASLTRGMQSRNLNDHAPVLGRTPMPHLPENRGNIASLAGLSPSNPFRRTEDTASSGSERRFIIHGDYPLDFTPPILTRRPTSPCESGRDASPLINVSFKRKRTTTTQQGSPFYSEVSVARFASILPSTPHREQGSPIRVPTTPDCQPEAVSLEVLEARDTDDTVYQSNIRGTAIDTAQATVDASQALDKTPIPPSSPTGVPAPAIPVTESVACGRSTSWASTGAVLKGITGGFGLLKFIRPSHDPEAATKLIRTETVKVESLLQALQESPNIRDLHIDDLAPQSPTRATGFERDGTRICLPALKRVFMKASCPESLTHFLGAIAASSQTVHTFELTLCRDIDVTVCKHAHAHMLARLLTEDGITHIGITLKQSCTAPLQEVLFVASTDPAADPKLTIKWCWTSAAVGVSHKMIVEDVVDLLSSAGHHITSLWFDTAGFLPQPTAAHWPDSGLEKIIRRSIHLEVVDVRGFALPVLATLSLPAGENDRPADSIRVLRIQDSVTIVATHSRYSVLKRAYWALRWAYPDIKTTFVGRELIRAADQKIIGLRECLSLEAHKAQFLSLPQGMAPSVLPRPIYELSDRNAYKDAAGYVCMAAEDSGPSSKRPKLD